MFSSSGAVILVDDADYLYLTKWKWQVSKMGYAVRCTNIGGRTPAKGGTGKQIIILMHREIMGLQCGGDQDRGRVVHHKNGNKLDNRKENLEITSQQNNARCAGLARHNSSGFKGVSWDKRYSKWIANIVVNMKNVYLGRYLDPLEAAIAYDSAALKHFGDYAKTNRILGLLDNFII
jgi:hypothetical protein